MFRQLKATVETDFEGTELCVFRILSQSNNFLFASRTFVAITAETWNLVDSSMCTLVCNPS